MNPLDLFEGLPKVDTKKCGICLKTLPVYNFAYDGGSSYLRYECKLCAKKQATTVAKIKKSVPKPPSDYRCPICGRNHEEIQGHSLKPKGWCADHDHETGEFRAWICHKCNLGLGNFSDKIVRLKSAVEYLEKYKDDRSPGQSR